MVLDTTNLTPEEAAQEVIVHPVASRSGGVHRGEWRAVAVGLMGDPQRTWGENKRRLTTSLLAGERFSRSSRRGLTRTVSMARIASPVSHSTPGGEGGAWGLLLNEGVWEGEFYEVSTKRDLIAFLRDNGALVDGQAQLPS